MNDSIFCRFILLLVLTISIFSYNAGYSYSMDVETAVEKHSNISVHLNKGSVHQYSRKKSNSFIIQFSEDIESIIGNDKIEDLLSIEIFKNFAKQTHAEHATFKVISKNQIECKLKNLATYSTKYIVKINSINGKINVKKTIITFYTKTPKITECSIERWENKTMPILSIKFNQKTIQHSVENNIVFKSIKTGKIFKSKISSQSDFGEKNKRVNISNLWFLKPESNLDQDDEFMIILNRGVESYDGLMRSKKPQVLKNIMTFGDMNLISIKCLLNNGGNSEMNAAKYNKCSASSPIILEFSTPIEQKQNFEKKIKLTTNKGEAVEFDALTTKWNLTKKTNSEVYTLILKANFNENTKYTLTINSEKISFSKKAMSKFIQFFKKNYINEKYLQDIFGQTLSNSQTINFTTLDHDGDFALKDQYIVRAKSDNPIIKDIIKTKNIKNIIMKYNSFTKKNGYVNGGSNKIGIESNNRTGLQEYSSINLNEIISDATGIAYVDITTNPKINIPKKYSSLFLQSTTLSINASIHKDKANIYLINNETNSPVNNADIKVVIWDIEKFNEFYTLYEAKTDSNGIAQINHGLNKYIYAKNTKNKIYIYAQHGDEIALLPLNNHFLVNKKKITCGNNSALIINKKSKYKVGEPIDYNIYIATNEPQEYLINVIDIESGQVILNKSINTTKDNICNIHGEFEKTNTIYPGIYDIVLINKVGKIIASNQITITSNNNQPFKIEAKINVFNKEKYAFISIQSKEIIPEYAQITIYEKNLENVLEFMDRGFYFSEEEKMLKNIIQKPIENSKIILDKKVKIKQSENKRNGTISIRIPLEEIKNNASYIYIDTYIENKAKKISTNRIEFKHLKSSIFPGIKLDKSIIHAGQSVNIHALIRNQTNNPAKEKKIEVQQLSADLKNWESVFEKQIDNDKKNIFMNFKPSSSGIYKAIIKTTDYLGNTSISSKTFSYIGGEGESAFLSKLKKPIIQRAKIDNEIKYILFSPFNTTVGNLELKQGETNIKKQIKTNKKIHIISFDSSLVSDGKFILSGLISGSYKYEFKEITIYDYLLKTNENPTINFDKNIKDSENLIIEINGNEEYYKPLTLVLIDQSKISSKQYDRIIEEIINIGKLNCTGSIAHYSLFKHNKKVNEYKHNENDYFAYEKNRINKFDYEGIKESEIILIKDGIKMNKKNIISTNKKRKLVAIAIFLKTDDNSLVLSKKIIN